MRFVLALLMVLTAAPSAAGALAIRPARPADDVAHPDNGWNEEWRVIAFDPRTHGSVGIYFVARPVPLLSVQVRVGAKAASTGAELPYGLLPHAGPGVTIANRPDAAPPQPNSLSYVGGRYLLDLTWPARGHLTIVPRRAGVTVGTWHLGRERVLPANPPRYVPGTMLWSVPVAVGTASGWIEADRTRVTLRGWRAYHDHIWGRYRLASSTWAHSDLAVVSPRPGEAWILHGLEPTPDGYHTTPNDKAWQGVLVHATPAGVTACRARVERSGWRSYFLNLLGSGWDYFLPTQVRGLCGRRSLTVRTMSIPWPVFGGFSGGVQASSPLAAGNGWLEHRVPVLPNT